MDESAPLVSIIVPTYRRPRFLARALASVYAQSYPHWELIVVDDNPPESAARRDTEALMAGHSRARYLKHPHNRGGSAARNTGISAARGAYLAFLDDDDAWLPDKLARQVAILAQAAPEVALVYTGIRQLDPEGHCKGETRPNLAGNLLVPLMRGNLIGTTSSVLCRRAALAAIGGFDEQLAASQDYDLFFRLAQHYQFAVIPEPLTLSYQHAEGNIGSNPANKVAAYWRFYRKHQAVMQAYPQGELAHLKWMARYFVRTGYRQEAAQALRRARQLARWDAECALLALLNRLSPSAQAQLWRWRRKLLAASGRIAKALAAPKGWQG